MFMFCIYVVMLCLLFCIYMYVVMLYLFFEFMLLCYVFFCFIVACNPMPACPANYQRLGIPAGVAGVVLQSCYRVITPLLPVDFRGAAVSICTCYKLC